MNRQNQLHLRMESGDIKLMLELAYYAGQTRRYESAVKIFKGVLAVQPWHAVARIGMANTLLVVGQHHAAERLYLKTLEDHPSDPFVVVSCAEFMMLSGNHSGARLLVNKALRSCTDGVTTRLAKSLLEVMALSGSDGGGE